jgi:hypothetical protein
MIPDQTATTPRLLPAFMSRFQNSVVPLSNRANDCLPCVMSVSQSSQPLAASSPWAVGLPGFHLFSSTTWVQEAGIQHQENLHFLCIYLSTLPITITINT